MNVEGPNRRNRRRPACVAVAVSGALLLGACATTSRPSTTTAARSNGAVVHVVAAENFWGSIAAQIGGVHAEVTSIIVNPNTDPHSYEPTASDAKVLAGAQFVIENGIGYDPWVPRLLAADQGHPTVLDVGDVVGVPEGGNPHRWYNPTDVQTVIAAMVQDLQALDPADAPYFRAQAASFDSVALAQYDQLIAAIRDKYTGTPVGASESIFAMLAPALGLNLITPPTFLKAISEGTDVSAADKATIDDQIKNHLIKIYVYNSQNVTPDVQVQLAEVKAEHIPYAKITETLAPADATYQAWQTRQLIGIETALARAGSSAPGRP